jgi:hypothetical protein
VAEGLIKADSVTGEGVDVRCDSSTKRVSAQGVDHDEEDVWPSRGLREPLREPDASADEGDG